MILAFEGYRQQKDINVGIKSRVFSNEKAKKKGVFFTLFFYSTRVTKLNKSPKVFFFDLESKQFSVFLTEMRRII
jgi:hypothetical protein